MTMQFGIVLPGGDATQQLGFAEAAERAGWDGVFVWEAAFGIDAWALLAAMAVRTERIRLGTLLTPLAWRRPWKLASQLITVDQLSNGRVILSVGLGAPAPELGLTGEPTDRRHRAELLDDGLGVIDALTSGDRTFDGLHHHIDLARPMYDVAKVVQQPRPPIWIVGLWDNERSMSRVLRAADGYLPNLPGGPQQPSAEQVAAMRAWLDSRAPQRSIDIVIEGMTPADEPGTASAAVAPFAAAGATWWIEAAWSEDASAPEAIAALEHRIAAGPPRP